MKQHMELMGFKVRDAVTGFEGVVETIAFDLYGCVQAIVKPGLDDKGQVQDGRWFDVKRLTAISDKPVMEPPTYSVLPPREIIGGSQKPAQMTQPIR